MQKNKNGAVGKARKCRFCGKMLIFILWGVNKSEIGLTKEAFGDIILKKAFAFGMEIL